MKLSTKARYGLRALCHIAHRGYSSAHTIAERQQIPARYLEEIIGELRKAGYVIGKRGPRGGYRLSRPPEQISVSEVLAALIHSSSGTPGADAPNDEVTRWAERSVDQRVALALGPLTLDELLGEAKDQCRRHAADYVI